MVTKRVVVVGSINQDLLLFQDRLPLRGETYSASDLREEFGGKGANQAVQCARLGFSVTFAGAVGSDLRGAECRRNLEDNKVRCHIAEVNFPTGLGVVNVLPGGEVHATIVAGANSAVPVEWIMEDGLFEDAGIVILQNEVSAEVNAAAIGEARRVGATIVYNAAPARPEDASSLENVDFVIVNEEEALAYAGMPAGESEMTAVARKIARYSRCVVVTLGAQGSLVAFGGETRQIPAHPVEAVDTTGAGDAFVGAFACALLVGESEFAAATIASRVAAEATRGVGAQTTMTSTWDVEDDSLRTEAPHSRGVAEV